MKKKEYEKKIPFFLHYNPYSNKPSSFKGSAVSTGLAVSTGFFQNLKNIFCKK